ncbi:putative disease resistance protein RGA3 [Phragmites australis]|uniref:putative disease resistance protein RGA3 n=1 Tax=Phragmites australis TaxID=29695 RepID=UPI002D786608|nr:putative disease resistance protein RGA3 [Phragmites australis]
MAEVFASLSIGTAWEKLSSFLWVLTASSLAPSPSSSVAMDLEELRKLERTMRRILATLHDAEEHWNIQEESTKLRLRELKELAYTIEEIVNKREYEADQRTVEALKGSTGIHYTSKRKRQEENGTYSVDTGVVEVTYELVSRVTKLTERFDEIRLFANHFSLSENDGGRWFTHDISSSRHTSSFVFEKRILGRDEDKDILVEKLLSGEGTNGGSHVSVLAIVGTGGLGKTTLARLVYNDPRLRQSFDEHAWVYVSELFDVSTTTRNIISSLTKGTCEYTELAHLQEKLADEIKEKRVLLVLDDVWNERGDCWELLCTPLSTAKICQIILTTRSEEVARLAQTMPFYRPSFLSFDDSWSLFKQVAFPADQESDTPANLIEIGKSIVKKCKGLPVAVKTLGSMLCYETDENRWEDVLENESWTCNNQVTKFYQNYS